MTTTAQDYATRRTVTKAIAVLLALIVLVVFVVLFA